MSGIMNNGELHVTWVKEGNVKIGRGDIWAWNTLKGNEPIHVEYHGHTLDVCGTCGNFCRECTKICYVNKSYRYQSVKYGQAVNTLAIRGDAIDVFNQLRGQLKRARKKPNYIRLHVSGEYEDINEILIFTEMAKEFPNITFYTYSKAFPIWEKFLNMYELPKNFVLNVSIWHKCGQGFWRKWKHLVNVRAFVYVDSTYDYSLDGLRADNWCNAYNEKGKLNHDVTCNHCKKCMNCTKKITFCYEH